MKSCGGGSPPSGGGSVVSGGGEKSRARAGQPCDGILREKMGSAGENGSLDVGPRSELLDPPLTL